MKKLLSNKSSALLSEFAKFAKDWGWVSDQGTGKRVDTSKKNYNSSLNKLRKHILALETKVQRLK